MGRIIQVVHPKTNEVMQIDISNVDLNQLFSRCQPSASEDQIRTGIANLPLQCVSNAAEIRSLLGWLADYSVKIGDAVLYIGRKVLEIVLFFVKNYPNTAIGMVVGAAVGMLLSSIPVLGWLLGWLIVPLCTALGMAIGFWNDIQEKQLKSELDKRISHFFGQLQNIPVAS